MGKLFDENGDEVTAFTQEELDAAKKEAVTAAKTADEEAAAATAKEKENADIAAADNATKTDAQKLEERLARIEAENTKFRVEKLADQFAGDDKEKRIQFMSKFDRLTGYEDTPEGMAERASDAVRLAFGIEAGVDTAGLGDSGGRGEDSKGVVQSTEADKDIQSMLGISSDDVQKYSKDANGDKK